MPQNAAFDFALQASGQPLKPFMLVRAQAFRGRAWKRSGVPITAGFRSPEEQRFESTSIPTEIAFTDVYNDFSGGYGYAYNGPGGPPVYHYAENYDARFSNQLVHAQAMIDASLADSFDSDFDGGFQWLIDLPLTAPVPPIGFGAVAVYGRKQNLTGNIDSWRLMPKTGAFPAGMDATYFSTTDRNGKDGPPAIFGSFFYVGGASGAFVRYTLDALTGTQGPIWGQGFLNAGNRLWTKIGTRGSGQAICTAVQSLAAGADAMSGSNWSATLPVGNGQRSIQDMEALDSQVFLGLADGIYAGDQSGSFVNVTGPLAQQANADNFRDLCVHDGQVIGQHIGGILAYDPKNTTGPRVRQIGAVHRSNRSAVRGLDTAIESYGGWLYAGKWNGSASYLMAGRDVGQGAYQWHVLNRIPAPGRIARLHFDGISAASGVPPKGIPNRLWVAMEGSFGLMQFINGTVAPLYFQAIPQIGGNPLAPDPLFSANYNGSAQMFLPSNDRGAPGVQKVYETAEVWADAMASGSRYLQLYYAIDRGTRTLAGYAASSPVTVIPLGSTNGYFPAGKSIEWSWDSYTTTAGSCHVLRSLVVYGKMRPRVVSYIKAVARIADGMTDRQGNLMRPAAVMMDDLRSFETSARLGGVPIALIDLAGATQFVCFLPPVEEQETYEVGAQNPEVAATIQMVVMNLSAY